jgi:hypothetical protein
MSEADDMSVPATDLAPEIAERDAADTPPGKIS